MQGHISGVVDVPHAGATLGLPTDSFEFDVKPNADGPVKAVKGGTDLPLAKDK